MINISQNNMEYHNLTKTEKDKLLKMFEEYKKEKTSAEKAVPIKDSGKNASHDIARTWKAIHNEVSTILVVLYVNNKLTA